MESQIALSGYVGTDVEFGSGADWTSARFRLGCTPRWRKGNEWVAGETTWMSVRVHGPTALNVRDSVRKGDPLVVCGRLRTHTWVDAGGAHREQLVVEASSLGHDMARGVSSFVRPERQLTPPADDEPLGPADDQPMAPAPSEEEDIMDAEAA